MTTPECVSQMTAGAPALGWFTSLIGEVLAGARQWQNYLNPPPGGVPAPMVPVPAPR
jgi:hypothetical protein